MNVLIVGECFSENLGDAVICQTVSKIITEQYKDVNITFFDLSGRINYQEYYKTNTNNYDLFQKLFYKFSSIFDKELKHISCFYRNYKVDEIRHIRMYNCFFDVVKNTSFDLVIFAGGALFMDFFSIPIYIVVKYFYKKKVNVLFNSVGMGNLSADSIRIFKKIMLSPNVKSVSVRDSYERFITYFGKNKIKQTYDIATNCYEYYFLNDGNKIKFGIGIIGLEKFKMHQKYIVDFFMKSGLEFKLFTNGAIYDHDMAIEILSEIGIPKTEIGSYILKRPINDKELIETIGCFENIISFRMHSLIIASSFNINTIGCIWDNKVKEFYNKLGFPNHCVEPDELINNLTNYIENKMDITLLSKQHKRCSKYAKELLLNEIKKFV